MKTLTLSNNDAIILAAILKLIDDGHLTNLAQQVKAKVLKEIE